MKVLVDTSVWSLALRRPKTIQLAVDQQTTVNALAELVRDGRAVLMGAIRQELLCGIKTQGQFESLRVSLTAFDDVALSMQDYELAAKAFNTCRTNGVQGSNTDFLICAVSINHHLPIFSLDQDFEMYRQWLPIHLYSS
jgi:predicted nucleic acid-binding protein